MREGTITTSTIMGKETVTSGSITGEGTITSGTIMGKGTITSRTIIEQIIGISQVFFFVCTADVDFVSLVVPLKSPSEVEQ